jgi:CRP-like cAMP-binding protein
MALKDDIALLRQVPAFNELEEDHLRLLAFGAERHPLDDGQVLYREKSVADCAYVIARGVVELSRIDRSGQPVDAGEASNGAMLGELAMVVPVERQSTAIARGPAEVMRITRALFHRMVEEYPEVGHRTEARLRARYTELAGRLSELSRKF